MERKYFKRKADAIKACEERKQQHPGIGVHKMRKGTRHHGEWAVCSYMEWLNTY